MRRLIWAFAGRTYHIVGNLMSRLILSAWYYNILEVGLFFSVLVYEMLKFHAQLSWAWKQLHSLIGCLNGQLNDPGTFVRTAKTRTRLGVFTFWSKSSLGPGVLLLVLSWNDALCCVYSYETTWVCKLVWFFTDGLCSHRGGGNRKLYQR